MDVTSALGASIGFVTAFRHYYAGVDNNDYLILGDDKSITDGGNTRGWDEIRLYTKGKANRARVTQYGFSPKRLGVWDWDGDPTLTGVDAGVTGQTITGSDFAGQITFDTTGSPPGANTKLFSLDFFEDYPDAFFIVAVSPFDDVPTGAEKIHVRSRAAGTVDFYTKDALAASTTYKIGYQITMVTAH